MDDLISRQAAIKLAIDLDCESRGIIKESKCREIENRYNMIPSAQPEIIRCKDCNHYDGEWCFKNRHYLEDYDFCSRAERRTDERLNQPTGGN